MLLPRASTPAARFDGHEGRTPWSNSFCTATSALASVQTRRLALATGRGRQRRRPLSMRFPTRSQRAAAPAIPAEVTHGEQARRTLAKSSRRRRAQRGRRQPADADEDARRWLPAGSRSRLAAPMRIWRCTMRPRRAGARRRRAASASRSVVRPRRARGRRTTLGVDEGASTCALVAARPASTSVSAAIAPTDAGLCRRSARPRRRPDIARRRWRRASAARARSRARRHARADTSRNCGDELVDRRAPARPPRARRRQCRTRPRRPTDADAVLGEASAPASTERRAARSGLDAPATTARARQRRAARERRQQRLTAARLRPRSLAIASAGGFLEIALRASGDEAGGLRAAPEIAALDMSRPCSSRPRADERLRCSAIKEGG